MRKYNPILCAGLSLALFFSCHSGTNVENQGVHIDYTDSGKGDTALVFVHGWCINKTYWSGQIDHFKDRYRVVTVDLPGFGESGKNRTEWTPEAYGADVDSVLSKLDLKHAVLIGHSMAGDIVVNAAINAPGRVIALVGVDNFKNIRPETEEQKNDDARTIVVMKEGFVRAVSSYFQEDLFSATTTDTLKKRILTDAENCDSAIAINVLAHLTSNETPSLNAYGKKLYLISSDVTTTDTAALSAAHVPYELFFVHGTGHFPMVEKPAEFNAQLDAVMAKL